MRVRRSAVLSAAISAIASFSLTFLSSPAAAQTKSDNLPSYLPFSACYMGLGASIGYGRLATNDNMTGIGTGTGSGALPLAADGALASLNGGCDVHFNRFVLGGFAQYAFGDVGLRAGDTSVDINRQWVLGARLGYLIKEEWMVYSSLGLAYGHAETTITGASFDKELKGLRLGLGSEFQVARPVWLRLEGAATRYDKVDLTGSGDTVAPTIYSMTAAVVFKF